MSDRRHIDLDLGRLEGEAAEQRAAGLDERPAYEVFSGVPARGSGPGEPATYYDRPVLKEPVWIWAVPVYFHVGGVAGATATLGAAAQLFGRGDMRGLVRRCRRIAAGGVVAGAGLLVYDLGRPERFLNMLRVFRPTAPLNVGSWILAASGPLSGAAAVLAEARGPARAAGDAAGAAAGLLGLPLSCYAAVLLSTTAVPVWQSSGKTLPILFASSAVAGATALLAVADLEERESAAVRCFGWIGKVGDLAAMALVEQEVSRVERVGAPLKEGLSGALWKAARVLGFGSVAASLLPRRWRSRDLLELLLGTAGGLCLRFAIFHAGKASARDPRATFELQRYG